MFPEKLFLNKNQIPKNNEYKANEPSYTSSYKSGYQIRDEPLSAFKKDSKYRLFGEQLLKDYNYDKNEYTLFLHLDFEWLPFLYIQKK